MIIKSIQHIFDYVRHDFRMRVYKTVQDTKTMKEQVICEVYTHKGAVEKLPDKGHTVDRKV